MPARTGPRETQRRAERSFRRGGVGFPDEPSPRNHRDNPPRSRQFGCKKCSRAFIPKTIFEFELEPLPNFAQLYLARMLKRTVPAGFIAPRLNRSAALQADCNSFYLNVEDANRRPWSTSA